jgi:hypothetical protein
MYDLPEDNREEEDDLPARLQISLFEHFINTRAGCPGIMSNACFDICCIV